MMRESEAFSVRQTVPAYVAKEPTVPERLHAAQFTDIERYEAQLQNAGRSKLGLIDLDFSAAGGANAN
jgi:hypothetical protein